MTYLCDEKKSVLKKMVLDQDPRPWGTLFERMNELLKELEWASFKELEDEELWQKVRGQARRKFEGVGHS